MNRILHFVLALVIIIGFSLLASHDRKLIRIRHLIQLLVLEILLGWSVLSSTVGIRFARTLSEMFEQLLQFAYEGTNFVFGNIQDRNLSCFFFRVLCPITFISALIGIFQYLRILPIVIRTFGTLLSKVSGMGKLESFNAISSLILGQSENFILYKEILDKIPPYRMYTMTTTAMSTVSLSMIGSYMTMLEPKYVIAALLLNMLSTFIILSIVNPYFVKKNEEILQIGGNMLENQNFFEILSEYILVGFKVAITITAMLIGFIALISALNSLFSVLLGIPFCTLLSYIFYPIAWVIGISEKEALQVGGVMATKLVSNEFLAIIEFQKISDTLSPHAKGVLSVFLISFANFSSIGIISGAIKSLNNKKGEVTSHLGLKQLYSSTLVSILSASITSLIL